MSGGVTVEAHGFWTFGLSAGASNALGSTGIGTALNLMGLTRQQSIYVQTDGGSTCAYQILTSLTSTGPWSVISSGTLSTGAVDLVQHAGPLAFVAPRIKTLTSTTVQVFVELWGN